MERTSPCHDRQIVKYCQRWQRYGPVSAEIRARLLITASAAGDARHAIKIHLGSSPASRPFAFCVVRLQRRPPLAAPFAQYFTSCAADATAK